LLCGDAELWNVLERHSNALPGVEKQRKVGDREALIDQLWSAIEALPNPDRPSDAKAPSKQAAVIAMLQRPKV